MTSTETPAEEKRAGALFTLFALMVAGPVGAVVAALAVGVEQAFARSGFNGGVAPRWLGGGSRAARASADDGAWRVRQVARAQREREFLADEKAAAAARSRSWREHRAAVRAHTAGGSDGPKPQRPARRGIAETLGAWARQARARYAVLDDRMARGNERVNDEYYPRVRRAASGLWGFVTGFGAGVRQGWNGHRGKGDPDAEPESADGAPDPEPDGKDPEPSDDQPADDTDPGPDPAGDPEVDLPLDDPAETAIDPGATAPDDTTPNGDEHMGENSPAPAAPAVQGESNATVIVAQLQMLDGRYAKVSEVNLRLKTANAQLVLAIRHVLDVATVKKAPLLTRRALAEASEVVAAVNQSVAAVAEALVDASSANLAATAGMMPAVKAEEKLVAAGAGTGIVAEHTGETK